MQPSLFSEASVVKARDATSGTFTDNMKLPVHRWFRFSAGFSAGWVQSVIDDSGIEGPIRVLDPFAGSGTTLLAAEDREVEAMGVEAHPFIVRIAEAKLLRRTDPSNLRDLAERVRKSAARRTASIEHYPTLIRKCFTDDRLEGLDVIRRALEANQDDSPEWRLAWLALVACLRSVSHVGTAQWQYVLPNKSKAKSVEPFDGFTAYIEMFARDMMISRESSSPSEAIVVESDARTCEGIPDDYANLVITSPPYPNNYDYADATRLEMSFMGEIKGWGDLQTKVRSRLVRACSQHVPQRAVNLDEILESGEVAPIIGELEPIVRKLDEIRTTKGGKKTYHLMVACYFYDLAQVWRALRRTCASPSRVCFVIGDSAPYGVYVPAVEWLGTLAEAAGFDSWTFEKTRDRNVKWKNRKHRVPLCEGRLWVEG